MKHDLAQQKGSRQQNVMTKDFIKNSCCPQQNIKTMMEGTNQHDAHNTHKEGAICSNFLFPTASQNH